MQEALAKINELAGVLMQRIEFNNRVGKETNDKAGRLNEKEAVLDAKEIDLGIRETKIKSVENTIAAREDAVRIKKEAEDILKAAHLEKDNFNKSSVVEREAIAAAQRKLNEDMAKLEKGNVLLQKEWEAFNKKKETMRADLINEIMKSNVR